MIARRLVLTLLLGLAACAPQYTLVAASPVAVAKNSLRVTPGTAWNRAPRTAFDIAWEENWTANGPLLYSIGFIGGLPDGEAIVRQRRKADQKVPVFRATMTPPDLVAMVESFYRIKQSAAVFEAGEVAPLRFAGEPGLRFDYRYVGGDSVRRRGRAVMAIHGGKLYLLTLDGTALHYFDAALPAFDAIVATAAIN